ncbi:MAG TPA: hypothetical protein VFL42_05925, partial [Terriglobales bacterium]|nr:hypothetical protein [Terriglobales bacterium]
VSAANEAQAPQSQVPAAALGAEFLTTARQMLKEAEERSRLYLAERNARREEKLLELTERKALAQERANELQAARRAASARLKELLRMGGTEPLPASPQPLDEAEPEHVPASASLFAQVRERVNEGWRMLLGRRYSPQVQAVLTGVAAIMALFVLGMAIASLRPRPALSNSRDGNYKGVTVKTGGTTVTTTPAPAKSPATRPSPVVVRTAPNTGKQSPAHRAGDALPQSDSSDVTVRRLKGQAPAPKPAAKNTPQNGIKRITDLDN